MRTTLKNLIPFDKLVFMPLAGKRTAASIFHGEWKTGDDGKKIAVT
ncbi:MAG TPA: hypothetical protein VGI46_18615 [Candidatus Acidoferrum sp.]